MRLWTQKSTAAVGRLVMTFIFWMPAFGHTLSYPVTTGAGGSLTHFYCSPAKCAAQVASVFCDDKQLLHGLLPVCSGPPLLHTVCQLNGRAFASSPVGSSCEFEKAGAYIPTQHCTETDPICLWIHATSPSPTHAVQTDVSPGYIALAVIIGVALLGAIGLYCYCSNTRRGISRPGANQEQNSDPDVGEHLADIQPSGDTTERETEVTIEVDPDAARERGHGD